MKPSHKRQNVKFSSAVLGVHLPMWRSKLVVFLLFMAFVALAARVLDPGAATRSIGSRAKAATSARSICRRRAARFSTVTAVLATSLPVRAIWAIPDAVPDDLDADKVNQLGKLLGMTSKELRVKLSEDKGFVYVKRQVPIDVADKVAALDIPGIYQRNEYKRFYPEGEITAHLIGFTNVEDEGQEGVELGDQKMLSGTSGMRRVIKDRMGHIVEDVAEQIPAQRHRRRPVDRQQDPVHRVREPEGRRREVQGEGRRGDGRRRAHRRGARTRQLPDIQPERPLAHDGRAVAQPDHDRRVRASRS